MSALMAVLGVIAKPFFEVLFEHLLKILERPKYEKLPDAPTALKSPAMVPDLPDLVAKYDSLS